MNTVLLSRPVGFAIGLFAVAAVVPAAQASPTLEWSTYYGGTGSDVGWDVTFDSNDSLVTVGYTDSSGAVAGNIAGNVTHDASHSADDDGFVTKFDVFGVREWGTYYGGAGIDIFHSVAVDGGNNVIAVGYTQSVNTGNVIATLGDTVLTGTQEAMLVKFGANGSRTWGRYLGGNNIDAGYGVCVSSDGTIYVVGSTTSTDLGLNALHQSTRQAATDAFIAKVSSAGTLLWVNYYGGSNGTTTAYDCVVDASNNIFMVGVTKSNNGIAANGWDNTYNGGSDAFLAKFTSSGVLSKGTYYGGAAFDVAHGVDIDDNGNIYVAGSTNSANTAGNLIDSSGAALTGGQDAFVVKFNSNFYRQWGRYYGGSAGASGNTDEFTDIETNGTSVVLSGVTKSINGISTPDAFGVSHGGGYDGMFVNLSASDGSTFYGTYITGSGDAPEFAYGVALSFGKAAVTGNTYGEGMATSGAHDETHSVLTVDAFIMLIRLFIV